ncbi:MAG: plastocyanin [Chloroflexi bacterium]|nr:plastocyanin [Chloroflexota bacterium]
MDIQGFVLPNIAARVGDTVTWTNRDGVSHTTTSGSNGTFDGIGWNSPFLSFGQSFSHTFAGTGAFPYTCRVHPSMQGTVTVTV